jgi:hypothetical protein
MRGTLAITAVFGLTGLTALAGCSDDPADVAGEYTISVANRDNGCNVEGWDDNATAANIAVTITQNGGSATAEVGGLTGNYLDFVLGDHIFTGAVDGNHLDLKLTGDNNFQSGTCDYHFDAVIDANIDGDVLTGEIRYEAVTDMAIDCEGITGCANVQEFNGTRPPT